MADPVLTVANQRKWKQWLEENHQTCRGVWLGLRKKGSAVSGLTHAEALDSALCYGWIDAQVRAGDAHSFVQRFVPRSKKSIWSKVNQGHVQRLIESGEMHASGLAEIERAKNDGRWKAAYEPQSRATVPDDLQAALDANVKAKDFFAKLDSKNRYAVLFRLQLAKRAETRARKLQQFVDMLAEHRTLH